MADNLVVILRRVNPTGVHVDLKTWIFPQQNIQPYVMPFIDNPPQGAGVYYLYAYVESFAYGLSIANPELTVLMGKK